MFLVGLLAAFQAWYQTKRGLSLDGLHDRHHPDANPGRRTPTNAERPQKLLAARVEPRHTLALGCDEIVFHRGSTYNPFVCEWASAVDSGPGSVVADSFARCARAKYWRRSSVGAGRGCRPGPGITGEYHSDRPGST
jgi:hypothetical protein